MTLAVRNYTSGAEIVANANAVRQRLMNPRNAFRPSKPAAVLQIVNLAAERPVWKREAIQFDEHVKAWQWYLASIKANKYQEHIKRRCVELGADYLQIMSDTKTDEVVYPRQLLMWELKTKFGLSYPRIGREFGKDHSTAVHAVKKISEIMGENVPVPVTGAQRLTSDRELNEEIRAAYDAGATLDDLFVRYAISRKAIVEVAKLEGWYKPERQRSGLKTFKQAKVNMAMLREDYEAGMSHRIIGLRHGISKDTVGRLIEKHDMKRAAEAK